MGFVAAEEMNIYRSREGEIGGDNAKEKLEVRPNTGNAVYPWFDLVSCSHTFP